MRIIQPLTAVIRGTLGYHDVDERREQRPCKNVEIVLWRVSVPSGYKVTYFRDFSLRILQHSRDFNCAYGYNKLKSSYFAKFPVATTYWEHSDKTNVSCGFFLSLSEIAQLGGRMLRWSNRLRKVKADSNKTKRCLQNTFIEEPVNM